MLGDSLFFDTPWKEKKSLLFLEGLIYMLLHFSCAMTNIYYEEKNYDKYSSLCSCCSNGLSIK